MIDIAKTFFLSHKIFNFASLSDMCIVAHQKGKGYEYYNIGYRVIVRRYIVGRDKRWCLVVECDSRTGCA